MLRTHRPASLFAFVLCRAILRLTRVSFHPALAPTSLKNPGVSSLSTEEILAIQALAWPDKWATGLRLVVDAHPFDLRGREYEREPLRDESKFIIMPKGAQLGLTTTFLTKTAHHVVQRKWKALYLLPLKAGTVDFVQSRIDPMLDSSPSLKAEFSRTDNRAQKVTRLGVPWKIRGTNIETELRETPCDILILDERDKMNEDNLPHAFARLDGSSVARVYELSTPTIDGFGVYRENGYPASDMMQWWVPCPHCGSKQVLSFDENILPYLGDTVQQSKDACRCQHCRKPISDTDRATMNAEGQWVPLNPHSDVRGYHLTQLNSPTKTLADPQLGLLVNYFEGQRDSKKLREFFNLGLGLPYAAAGDKFSIELMDSCRGSHQRGGIPNGPLFIGIDQGQETLHVTMYTQDRDTGRRRLYDVRLIQRDGARTKWVALDEEVLQRFSQWIAVCDAHPDKEDCEALAKKYPGRFVMGFEKDRPEQPTTANFVPFKWGEPAKVNIDRTMAFDSLIKNYLDGQTILSADARELGEYMPKLAYNGFYAQHLPMVRVEQPDMQNRMVARWVNGNAEPGKKAQGKKPDHWHHSDMFALIATMGDTPLHVPSEFNAALAAAGGVVG